LLQEHLEGTPYGERLVPAAPVIGALRGRKTRGELERLRAAVAMAEEIFGEVGSFARPGQSEAEVARYARSRAAERGVETAWDAEQCPLVTTGPGSMVGHGLPSAELEVRRGCILHLDFGVRRDGYCSDLQRAWYVPEAGERRPPETVQRAFDTVRAAIEAAAKLVRPGVAGWRVDEAARRVVVGAGYPEYQHATGHHVGRAAHDGGGVLGPRWERYGRAPYALLEPGNVVTLELGIDDVDGRGYLGLEEMAVVTDSGCSWLSRPQLELQILGT
jgi:Xaa-Pro aminopeptidase